MFNVGNVYKYIEDGNNKYFAYIGDSDDASIVFGMEVGLKDDKRDHFLIDGISMVIFSDRLLYIKAKTIAGNLFIRGKNVIIEKRTFNETLKRIINTLIKKYENNVENSIDNNYDSVSEALRDIALPEKIIRLLNWNETKRELKFDAAMPGMASCIRYGIYFAYLGTNIGSEINKLRPVVIWKKHESATNANDNSYFVFPVSSKIPAKNYYYNVQISVNGIDNVIKINDGKRISGFRIVKPLIDNSSGLMRVLSESEKTEVKKAISKYFNI